MWVGKWRGNWRMEWVASTLHTTSEHRVSSTTTITTADAHTSAANSRLNWRPRPFKWTRPFRRKTKSGFCACAITFQTQSTTNVGKCCGCKEQGVWILIHVRATVKAGGFFQPEHAPDFYSFHTQTVQNVSRQKGWAPYHVVRGSGRWNAFVRGWQLFIYNWYKIDTCFEVLLSFTVVTSIVYSPLPAMWKS